VSAHDCCEVASIGSYHETSVARTAHGAPRPPTLARRCLEITGWIVPGRPDALAKVPCVSGGLRRDWNRSRAFGVNRDVPADAACDTVYDIAVIPCGKTRMAGTTRDSLDQRLRGELGLVTDQASTISSDKRRAAAGN
jgi:hypothetical protein